MRRTPGMFRVMGKRYRLVGVDDADHAVARGADFTCLGATHFDRGLVRYRVAGTEVSVDEEADTVLHEVLHVAWYAGGLDDVALRQGDGGERVIRRLAPVLLDLLRRNPQLIAYLAEEAPFDGQEKAPPKAKKA